MPLPASDYSPLPPPGHPGTASGPSIHTSKNAPSSTNLKREFLLRIIAFTILELGFVVLAFVARRNPVILNLPTRTTLTEAKGAFTVISILWHTLAAFTVRGILLHIFSAECMEQYRTSGNLVPGETDIVSRITAGYIEQIKHFMLNKATVPFRISFASTLLLVFLNALGPSTISVSSITVYRPSIVQVANMTLVVGDNVMLDKHASLIITLEYLEGTDYGFTVNGSNILIPWPSPTPTSIHGLVAYESDVITYNFSCSWKQPTIVVKPGPKYSLIVGDQEWYIPPASPFPDNIVLSLNFARSTSSSVALLFGGGGNGNPALPALDLDDIPNTFIPPGVHTFFTEIETPHSVSILTCDPQMQVVPATVTLSNGSQLKAVPRSGPPIVKNIRVDAVSQLFQDSLVTALSSYEFSYGSVNEVAFALFLNQETMTTEDTGEINFFQTPLALDEINQNMNQVLMTSAKAYLSGYWPWMDDRDKFISRFNMMDTDGTVEVQVLALTTSRPFLVSLLVISCLLIALLAILVLGGKVGELREFDLENIMGTLT